VRGGRYGLVVRRFLVAALLGGVLGMSAGGCGGSSRAREGTSGAPGTHSTSTSATASMTTDTASSGSSSAETTAPPPVPAGTPAPPDGLHPATGYATYEMCASGCSGAVSPSLRRPLAFPSLTAGSSCASRRVDGPVKPLVIGPLPVKPFLGSAWEGARVTWTADSSYQGPVLIRGRRLGGARGSSGGGAVGFGEGHVPYDELQLNAPGQGAATPRGTGREWFTFTRVQAPGCYFYQVDGTGFTETILFHAVG